MIHDTKHLICTAKPNEEIYWERVNRSLGWLGNTEAEQRERQWSPQAKGNLYQLKDGELYFLPETHKEEIL